MRDREGEKLSGLMEADTQQAFRIQTSAGRGDYGALVPPMTNTEGVPFWFTHLTSNRSERLRPNWFRSLESWFPAGTQKKWREVRTINQVSGRVIIVRLKKNASVLVLPVCIVQRP